MLEGRQSLVDKYTLLECIQCGVCTGACPVAVKSKLNIRRLMREISVLGRVSDDELWSCTTCSTCELRCPKKLSPVDLVVGARSLYVEEGKVAPTVRDALESVYKNGNPWGRIRSGRTEWAQEMKIKHVSEGPDFLYYVCCTAAYDPRVQEVARGLVKTFDKAGVSFATLGDKENCCGSEMYGLGETGLFEMLVEENLKLFEKYGVERIVTTSPHCYNAFKNRYGKIPFQVLHYTQYVADLIDRGKLFFKKEVKRKVAYHDSCFLGKRNSIYDEPRKIIEAIPGLEFIEFDRSRERSLCCEGGGGRMWMDVPGERLAEDRIWEAAEIGAEVILTSCPFCLLTLEDAVKVTGKEDKVKIQDIAEILTEAFQPIPTSSS